MKTFQRLLLVAGPPCSGKSTIIAQLRDGRLSDVRKELGVIRPERWATATRKNWQQVLATEPDFLIMHYDFLYDFLRLPPDAERSDLYSTDPSLRPLELCQRARVVTLWTDPRELRRRVRHRRFQAIRQYWLRGKIRYGIHRDRRLRQMKRLYSEPEHLYDHYRRWFSFCASFETAELRLADTSNLVTKFISDPDLPVELSGRKHSEER